MIIGLILLLVIVELVVIIKLWLDRRRQRDLLIYRELGMAAVFLLLRNMVTVSSGVWQVYRADLVRYKHGWSLEHFLDGRNNWMQYVINCGIDPYKFAEVYGEPNGPISVPSGEGAQPGEVSEDVPVQSVQGGGSGSGDEPVPDGAGEAADC